MRKRLRKWDIHVYRFRCYPKGQEHGYCPSQPLWDEAKRMADFWNRLCALAAENHRAYQDILTGEPAYVRARAEYDAATEAEAQAWQELKDARAQAQKKTFAEAPLFAQKHALRRAIRQEAARALTTATKGARAARKPEIAALQDHWTTVLKRERQQCVLPFGNREFVLDHFKTALRKARKEGVRLHPKTRLTEMNFVQPFYGGIKKPGRGKDPAQAARDPEFTHMTWEKLQKSYGERVGIGNFEPTDKRNSAPIWHWRFKVDELVVPLAVRYHRPIPPGSVVKSVTLNGQEKWRPGIERAADGSYVELPGRWEWHVLLALEIPPQEKQDLPDRTAGIDVGWRKMDDGTVRVAVLTDDRGQTEELRLPRALIRRWEYLQDVQAAMSHSAEEVTTIIQAFPWPEQPDARALIRSMRHPSPPNLWKLHRYLAGERVPHYAQLQRWAAEQTERQRYHADMLVKLVGWRTYLYRRWAHRICAQYREIAVEDLDIKKMAEEPDKPYRLARSMEMRQLVAPYSLLLTLAHMASKRGTVITKHNPAYTSITCPVCGEILPENTGNRVLVCSQGHAYDQDYGASQIITAAPLAASP